MNFIFLAGRSVGGNRGTRSLQNCFFASSVETQTGKPKINKSRKSRALPSTNPGNTRNKERTGQTTSVPGNRQQNEAIKRKKQRNWNCFSSFPKLRPTPSKNACSRRKKKNPCSVFTQVQSASKWKQNYNEPPETNRSWRRRAMCRSTPLCSSFRVLFDGSARPCAESGAGICCRENLAKPGLVGGW